MAAPDPPRTIPDGQGRPLRDVLRRLVHAHDPGLLVRVRDRSRRDRAVRVQDEVMGIVGEEGRDQAVGVYIRPEVLVVIGVGGGIVTGATREVRLRRDGVQRHV